MKKRIDQTGGKDDRRSTRESSLFSSIIQKLKNKKFKEQQQESEIYEKHTDDLKSLYDQKLHTSSSQIKLPTPISLTERINNKISENVKLNPVSTRKLYTLPIKSGAVSESDNIPFQSQLSSTSSQLKDTRSVSYAFDSIAMGSTENVTNRSNRKDSPISSMSVRQAVQLADENNGDKENEKGMFRKHLTDDPRLNSDTLRPVQQTVLDSLASTLSSGKPAEDINADVPDISQNELRYERKLVHQVMKKKEFAEKIGLVPTKWTPKNALPHGKSSTPKSQFWQPEILSRRPSSSESSLGTASSIVTQQSTRHQRTVVKEVAILSSGMTLRDLASKLSMKLSDLEKKLQELGEDVKGWKEEDRGDHHLDADVAELLVLELGLSVVKKEVRTVDPAANANRHTGQTLQSRAPLVCIMGHVDHGKTTLLDTLRHASMAANEAGGITQKLSAFSVATGGRSVLFLDTPGHAAFASMRAHGVQATDLAVLVIALDDGVRPQTVEALKTAQNAGCPIIIALNKVDKIPVALDREKARNRCLTQLTEFGVVAEDFGGDVAVVEVAGKTGLGLDALVESLLFQADLLELKAAVDGPAEAVVLEASIEKGRGIVVDVLVKWGKLSVGDDVVVGTTFGRIKAMTDDKGKAVKVAFPSTAVRLLGLRSMPPSGSEMLGVESEARARQISERRERVSELKRAMQTANVINATAPTSSVTGKPASTSATATATATTPVTIPTLNVLLKADGVGTLDALRKLVEDLSARTSDVMVKIIGAAVGDVTKSDVEFADTASGALVLGFNIGVADASTRSIAKEQDVRIVRDTVIYRLEDELLASMTALMPRQRLLHSEGTAKVLKVFEFTDKSATVVAGLSVLTGAMRSGKDVVYQVKRQGAVLSADLTEAALKRFKDTVTEVGHGHECGLSIEKYRDYQEGDEVECFRLEWKTKELVMEAVRMSAMPYS